LFSRDDLDLYKTGMSDESACWMWSSHDGWGRTLCIGADMTRFGSNEQCCICPSDKNLRCTSLGQKKAYSRGTTATRVWAQTRDVDVLCRSK